MNWTHKIIKVKGFEKIAPFVLRVFFGDASEKTIDFRPVLKGAIFGPLTDEKLFDTVRLDPEIHTLVWANGADFDPATLYDWSATYQLPQNETMAAAETEIKYGFKE
ncbi:MAG: DUF2442 domain-containing protein [Pontiellaceae bacterium]|jgi:hypothetical protein|nr:DUF2442 domain-containing protein [Pontiellaceae bacterium]